MDNIEDLNEEQLQKMLMLLPGNMPGLSEIRDKNKGWSEKTDQNIKKYSKYN